MHLPNYSPFFDTIADESLHNTRFNIGRGHHFSVLQVKNTKHRFIVIWDEDHDTRIINVIEDMLLNQHLHMFNFTDVVAFGERKGCMSVITNNQYHNYPDEGVTAYGNNRSIEYGDEWTLHINDIGMMCNGEGMLEMIQYIASTFGIEEPLGKFADIHNIVKVPTAIFNTIE